jgi:hypothetical protein
MTSVTLLFSLARTDERVTLAVPGKRLSFWRRILNVIT